MAVGGVSVRIPGRGRRVAKIIVAVVLALVVGGWLLLTATTDYGAYPPARVYGWVFDHPLPPGVTKLKVSGYCRGLSREVFMRFAATDAAIESFTCASAGRRLSATESRSLAVNLVSRSDISGREARKVGWGEAFSSGARECYALNSSMSGAWYVTIAVDRARHRVFVAAVGH